MEQHGLSQYLNQLDFFEESEQEVDLDQEQKFFLENEPLPSNILEEEEPQLHSYPFQSQKTEERTYEKTVETQDSIRIVEPDEQEIVFTPKKVVQYRKTFHGTKDDTVELNTNFKTLLLGYFRELIYLKQMNPQQIEYIQQFSQRIPSFNSLRKFYGQTQDHEGIRRKCLEFLESGDCIRRILSGRCQLKTKLMMIKFIQKMRTNIKSEKTVKWKDKVHWRQKIDK